MYMVARNRRTRQRRSKQRKTRRQRGGETVLQPIRSSLQPIAEISTFKPTPGPPKWVKTPPVWTRRNNGIWTKAP
jgi:hypothetical protein